MRVELYHHPYEHMAGDAYSYWDDKPEKAIEELQNGKPLYTFALDGFEEGITVSADIDDDLFAIQEVGLYEVPKRDFEIKEVHRDDYWNFPDEKVEHSIPDNPQPPASALPIGVPDVKHTVYLQDFSDELQFKGVKTMSDSEIRWNYDNLNSYIIWKNGSLEVIREPVV